MGWDSGDQIITKCPKCGNDDQEEETFGSIVRNSFIDAQIYCICLKCNTIMSGTTKLTVVDEKFKKLKPNICKKLFENFDTSELYNLFNKKE
jgi:hypothetical protein